MKDFPKRRRSSKSRKGEARSHEVGYGKPPTGTRWKAGTSGNPKGRPKKSKNLKTIAREVLHRPVKMTIDGRAKHVPILEAAFVKQAESALRGSEKSFLTLIKLALLLDAKDEINAEGSEGLTPSEQELFDELIKARLGGSDEKADD